MITILRMLLRIPEPKVKRTQALFIAEELCKERGWQINRPRIAEGLNAWTIWVNGDVKGSPWIKIDHQSGKIIRAATLPK